MSPPDWSQKLTKLTIGNVDFTGCCSTLGPAASSRLIPPQKIFKSSQDDPKILSKTSWQGMPRDGPGCSKMIPDKRRMAPRWTQTGEAAQRRCERGVKMANLSRLQGHFSWFCRKLQAGFSKYQACLLVLDLFMMKGINASLLIALPRSNKALARLPSTETSTPCSMQAIIVVPERSSDSLLPFLLFADSETKTFANLGERARTCKHQWGRLYEPLKGSHKNNNVGMSFFECVPQENTWKSSHSQGKGKPYSGWNVSL